MRLWLLTRRVWALIGAAVICSIGLTALQNQFISMPVVLGTDGMAMWTTLLPLLWAIAVSDCFSSKLQSVEIRPSRRALLFDATLLVGTAACGAAVFAAFTGPHESGTGAVGHVLIMIGLACSVTLRGGSGAGVLAACAALIATSFYGVDAPAGAYVRIFQPDGDPQWALLIGIGSCTTAAGMLLMDRASEGLRTTDRLGD